MARAEGSKISAQIIRKIKRDDKMLRHIKFESYYKALITNLCWLYRKGDYTRIDNHFFFNSLFIDLMNAKTVFVDERIDKTGIDRYCIIPLQNRTFLTIFLEDRNVYVDHYKNTNEMLETLYFEHNLKYKLPQNLLDVVIYYIAGN